MIPARQSTAFELSVGPVLDAAGVAVTDCVVADFKIKKTTGNYAALNGSATLTHVSAGTYDLVLTATDMDTVGLATISIDDTVNSTGPVRIQVIEEAVYDAFYAAASAGIPSIPANWITAAGVNAAALNGKGDWLLQSNMPPNFPVMSIQAVGDGGRVNANVTQVNGAAAETLTEAEVTAAVHDTAMTQGYAAVNTAPTFAQMSFMIWSRVAHADIPEGDTTMTTFELDGTTEAMTFTLDDATEPTSITRAT
jgi:hypothetical protein